MARPPLSFVEREWWTRRQGEGLTVRINNKGKPDNDLNMGKKKKMVKWRVSMRTEEENIIILIIILL